MPAVVTNTNDIYLKFGSTVLSTYFTEKINYNRKADTEDVTAGAGATHIAREAKLLDTNMDFMLVVDTAAHATEIADLDIGTKDTLIYGPRGSTAGLPCFEGPMILNDLKYTASLEKTKHAYAVSFVQAGAPTKTIEGGGTF